MSGAHIAYVLHQADRAMILAQQLCAWVANAPDFDDDLALSNIALDLIGQARALYAHAGALEGAGRSEDHLAFLRDADEFLSPPLVEQPNGDFAQTIARQVLHDAYALALWQALRASADEVLAAIAAKAANETRYHLRYSSEWLIRMGDGTEESLRRAQAALELLWPYALELFQQDAIEVEMTHAGIGADPHALRAAWEITLREILAKTDLCPPASNAAHLGGRRAPAFAALLAEMQLSHRQHPGAAW
ncbi:MAG: 1,2-phenylacetyl-CoA epoxidase subunit PaaC [Hyphomonadaceae bacterium]